MISTLIRSLSQPAVGRQRTISVAPVSAVLLAVVALVSPAAAQDGLGSPAAAKATAMAAGENEPVVVVTLGSLNKMMRDVNYVTAMVGQPQAGGMFAMVAGSMAQGIDMDKPIGILVPLVDGVPQPIAVLPTSDVKSVLRRLEGQTGPADELDDGTLVIAIGMNTVYIKQVGSWAALAPKRELLELAPVDPTAYFSGMGNDYFVAIRVKMQQVPAETRATLVDQMRQGLDQAMAQSGNADAAKSANASLDQLAQVINEADQLDIGINVDQDGGRIIQDISFTAIPGTKLAEMYGGQKALPSKFSSVIRDDAAMFYHASATVSEAAVEQAKVGINTNLQMIDGVLKNADELSDEDRADIKELATRVIDLAMGSIEEGRADLGMLLLADESQSRLALGTFVADGQKAAGIVKDFAEKLKERTAGKPSAPKFSFDIETYNGTTIHRCDIPVSADEDEVRKVLGDTAQIHIGTADKYVYLAVGQDSLPLMRSLIDGEVEATVPSDRPVGQLEFKLLPVLEYIQSIESNDTVAAMINALLKAPDTGKFEVISDSIPNGNKTQVSFSEGLLKAIGAAITENQPAGAGGF